VVAFHFFSNAIAFSFIYSIIQIDMIPHHSWWGYFFTYEVLKSDYFATKFKLANILRKKKGVSSFMSTPKGIEYEKQNIKTSVTTHAYPATR
jgi:hypothetical protein